MMQPQPQPFVVTSEVALAKQTDHQFVEGLGFVAHPGPPELPAGANGKEDCNPPVGTKDGTVHHLRQPLPLNGEPQTRTFIWLVTQSAWKSPHPGRGNRLAWSPAHLSRAGWKYVGPAS